jgi:putative transcription factor
MLCDMCSASGKMYKTIVEGAHLSLCQDCSNFGKVIGMVQQQENAKAVEKFHAADKAEKLEIVSGDYAEKIRKKRESLGLKQKEFAQKLNEKQSIVQKMESGHFEPPIGLAKKIGKILHLKLVEQYQENHDMKKSSKTEAFTIGDFIKNGKK